MAGVFGRVTYFVWGSFVTVTPVASGESAILAFSGNWPWTET